DSPKTKLGLPEVLLGIHPGFGGTYRATRLMDAPTALDMMLQGRAMSASAAKRAGLVDMIIPDRQLMKAARSVILNPSLIKRPFKLWRAISNNRFVRPVLANLIRKKVAARVKQSHYPAPFAIIDLWKDYALHQDLMLRAEAKSVSKLITSPTAQNLIRVFFLQERLKSLGKKADIPAKHVHVIGAGTMGADIAAWCAAQGLRVTLQDREAKFIASGMKRAAKFFEKRFKKTRLVREVMDRFIADISGDGLKNADVIIEAVFESLEVKQELFRRIEPVIKEGAILATNTSSIPLENIATVLQRPDRLIGLHFFNPVAKMPLVEVVCSEQNPKSVIDQALSFVRLIDKLPLPVKSVPGFLVNRVLMPYLIEATVLVSEGIAPEVIDKTALNFGMPMGPIELADTVGLDVCLSVAEIFSKHYGLNVPELLQKMVKDGRLGKKSNHGFYVYKKGKKQKKPVQAGQRSEGLTERLIKPFLLEAQKCLNEKVVQDDELIDAGIIFGTGFAPFRGGPMHYLKDQPLEV
ncbi:MAG: 3-hydroxyacyl-CoA dehydrogenase NAD-binding domain-containing protein, partial [Chlamydiota bacterium]|nr:3-hydroxyacyl-CoA dehydrogenase NAD-binding domain-containing protein [Chlamydiota bacterium]